MPVDKSKYPDDWKQISQRIRDRAGNKCEQCGVGNGAYILRSDIDPERYMTYNTDEDCHYLGDTAIRLSEIPDEYDHYAYTRVVLTVHHKDFDTTNNADDNLTALCQLHHLRADAKNHARHAAETRRINHEKESGQLRLLEV